jgi:hypothetical protein
MYLKKYLPLSIEVLTGFILRPAVKTGVNGKERKSENDAHSTQLDIIVYDSSNYPIFQRFGNSVIVPPEGVLAIISVKKHLNDLDIKQECQALMNASYLCRTKGVSGQPIRGPFLSLVAMKSNISKKTIETSQWIFNNINSVYKISPKPYFDDLVGYIGSLSEWSIFKRRPQQTNQAEYLFFEHREQESHLGLQYILTGILSVFYDPTRTTIRRPGFTSFPERSFNRKLGIVEVQDLRKNQ